MDAPDASRNLWGGPPPELSVFESEGRLKALKRRLPGSDALIVVTARSLVEARRTYAVWSFSESHHGASELFARAADRHQKHAEMCRYHLPNDPPSGPSGSLHEYVRDRETTIDRLAAGGVARPLVTARACSGIRRIYADEGRDDIADLFDEIRTDLDELRSESAGLLETVCETDDQWEDAKTTVSDTIAVAASNFRDVGGR